MAIYTAVVVTEKNKEIIVYTDSLSAINQIDSYKKELSNRRKMKLHHHIILEVMFQIIKQFNLKLTLVKVKAHDGIWGNELADKLAKEALTGDRILTKDFGNENSYRLSWYSIKVEQNNRSFIKLINKVNKEIDEKKLKRMSNQHIDYDKKLSYQILNLDNEKINHTQNNQLEETSREGPKIPSKFLSIKGNKYKSWKFKKLISKLPTIKKLKIRMPKLYKKDLNCPRCGLREENMKHIWECIKLNNDLILLERENKEWIHELVHNYDNFRSKDELLDEIYKFTHAEVTLKEYNTDVNTKFY